MVLGEREESGAEDALAERSGLPTGSEGSCLGMTWPLEPRRSLEALPPQARAAGWFARSLAGMLPVGWVVEPFGLTRGWCRLHSRRTHTCLRCRLASPAVPTANSYAVTLKFGSDLSVVRSHNIL